MKRSLIVALAAVAIGSAACGGSPGTSAPTSTPTSSAGASSSQPATTTTAARLVVTKSGVSGDSYGNVGYGIVLNNPTGSDAINVTLQINLTRHGQILGTDSQTLTLIPAHTTYYVGGGTSVPTGGGQPTAVQVSSSIGRSTAAQYPLPKVSQVRVVPDSFGGLTAHGVVTNTLKQALSQLATVGIVYFNSNGQVIGGNQTYLTNDLAPGASAAFNDPIITAKSVTAIRVSVENNIGF